jgi:translation initiation factor 2 alpha subunit (eIF-2alpha)
MSRPQVVSEDVKPGRLKPEHTDQIREIVKNRPELSIEEIITEAREFLKSKKVDVRGITSVETRDTEGIEIHMLLSSYTYTRRK